MMSWLLVMILGSGQVVTERFTNKESCDAIRLWIQTKADVRSGVCLEDLPSSEPTLREEAPSLEPPAEMREPKP
jgi:hypothetical protein